MGNPNSGRRPQPTKLKALRGNPGQRKLNQAEPKPPEGVVTCPDMLSDPAKVVWGEIAPVCLAMGTLTIADVKAFAGLCELQATFTSCARLKGTADFDVKRERETAIALRPYYALFGLEPVSRSRIQLPKKDEAPVSKWAGALK